MRDQAYISFLEWVSLEPGSGRDLKMAALCFENLLIGAGDIFVDTYIEMSKVTGATKRDLTRIISSVPHEESSLAALGADALASRPKALQDSILKKIWESEGYEMKLGPLEGQQTTIKYENYKTAAYIMSEIDHWQRNYALMDFVGNETDRAVLGVLLDYQRPAAALREVLVRDFPDFSKLSWEDIFELRKNPHWKRFRSVAQEIAANSALGGATLNERFERALRDFAFEARPRIGSTIFYGVIGNLPLGPINPVGAASNATATVTAVHQQKDFGWMFFLLDALRAAEAPR